MLAYKKTRLGSGSLASSPGGTARSTHALEHDNPVTRIALPRHMDGEIDVGSRYEAGDSPTDFSLHLVLLRAVTPLSEITGGLYYKSRVHLLPWLSLYTPLMVYQLPLSQIDDHPCRMIWQISKASVGTPSQHACRFPTNFQALEDDSTKEVKVILPQSYNKVDSDE